MVDSRCAENKNVQKLFGAPATALRVNGSGDFDDDVDEDDYEDEGFGSKTKVSAPQ